MFRVLYRSILLVGMLFGLSGAYAPEVDIRAFGGDPTGNNDSTAALNTCLTKAGMGGTCYAGNGRFKILGDVVIPKVTTLSCGEAFFDSSDYVVADLGVGPALMLASGHPIKAGGQSAVVKGCLIVRNGMTFPAPSSSAYSGIALNDDGKDSFTVLDTVITGFDTAIYSTGPRPFIQRVYLDGNGVTNAVLAMENGGVDIGYLYDIKIQSLGTDNRNGPGGVNCTALRRPGTGMRLNAFHWVGNIIAQNFSQSQFEIKQQMYGGNLWADDVGAYCGFIDNVGVLFKESGYAFGTSISINSVKTGIKFVTTGSPQIQSYLPNVWLDNVNQDGIVLGDLSNPALFGMNVTIGLLSTNAFGTTNVGRYAVNYADGSTNSRLNIQKAYLTGVHGGVAPYFKSTTTNNLLGRNLLIGQLRTDLANGSNPYDGFAAGANSEPMINDIFTGLGTCTGLGTGTCTIAGSMTRGSVTLAPAGGFAGTGVVPVFFPIPSEGSYNCVATLGNGTQFWPSSPSPFVQIAPFNASTINLVWNSGSAFTPAQTYRINYMCKP